MPSLAIVIPYYKIDFFEETLASVAAQTDKRFTLYIGNDASPNDPLPLIRKYFPEGDYHYFDYKENLGGQNLAMQWERILENVTEEWFQILGDDDMVSENFVAEFYANSDNYNIVNFIKLASEIVDENNSVIISKTKNIESGYYRAIESFTDKLAGRVNSSLSEHIFRTASYRRYGFRKYPLAWHSDDFFLLEISQHHPTYYFLQKVLVRIKETTKSISGSQENLEKKQEATKLFYTDIMKLLRTIRCSNPHKKIVIDSLMRSGIPFQIKDIYYSLYPKPIATLRLMSVYVIRYFNKYSMLNDKHKNLNAIIEYYHYRLKIKLPTLIKRQRKRPLSIPVIIINYNQLNYLKQLVNFLLDRKFENIIIIDNKSTYPPLISYYKELENLLTIVYMDENYGYDVLNKKTEILNKYGKGYYIVTDSDIVPNDSLPADFLYSMIRVIDKYYSKITKVGFALDIDDLPDYYPLKQKVIKWEKRFWTKAIGKDVYSAMVDTTFALYKPGYRSKSRSEFLRGIRLGGAFTAKHGGWYVNPDALSDEERFYMQTANKSSSWRINSNGEHLSKEYDQYIT